MALSAIFPWKHDEILINHGSANSPWALIWQAFATCHAQGWNAYHGTWSVRFNNSGRYQADCGQGKKSNAASKNT